MPPIRTLRHILPVLLLVLALCCLVPAVGNAQAARTLIRAGRLIDGESDRERTDQGILIEGTRIVRVGPFAEVRAGAPDAHSLDLSSYTVLPGLIDNHTHILLQGDAALRAGFNTIEHGYGLTPDLIERMIRQKVYWCPTIFVGAYVAEGRGGIWPKLVEIERQAFGEAIRRGLLPWISYGTDAGGYAWTEHQAQGLDYMVRYGMTPMQAIKSATSVAARLLDQSAGRCPGVA